eukprot:2344363-Prymnesium_polylepis.1
MGSSLELPASRSGAGCLAGAGSSPPAVRSIVTPVAELEPPASPPSTSGEACRSADSEFEA